MGQPLKLYPANPASQSQNPDFAFYQHARLISLLLALITVIIYLPVGFHEFINFDDPGYVSENRVVQNGLTWTGMKWAFTGGHEDNWHPLTWLSHELDCQLFGLNAGAHHLINVLFHAANVVLLFQLWRRLTRACWPSALLAALFAWHPVHVESVAWVAERKDVLSTFFGLWALLFYARYAQGLKKAEMGNAESRKFYWLAWGSLALGLLSKPMLVTWPFVLLLLDFWPLGRFQPGRTWSLVREKIPFFALVVASSVVTFWAQQRGGTVAEVRELPLGARVGNALISYCRYLEKLFWPTDLTIYYTHPGYWPFGEVLLAGLLLVGLSGLIFLVRRRHPYLLMGWLWYGGTLVPVIGLVQVGEQAMADRYAYIPSVGVLIMVIWGAKALTRRWHARQRMLFVAGLAAAVCCLGLTWQQLGYWRNSETLFRHALAITENNYVAHFSLGRAFLNQGRTDAAISQFQATLRLKPNHAEGHNDLGLALFRQGRLDEAISEYRDALRLIPEYVPAHNNLGAALDQQGHLEEAIREYQIVLRLEPENVKAHNNLGIALAREGQWNAAISQFQAVLSLQPENFEAQSNLAKAQALKNQTGGGSP
jgi:tetratricopeptide (TPR) repeat protein